MSACEYDAPTTVPESTGFGEPCLWFEVRVRQKGEVDFLSNRSIGKGPAVSKGAIVLG